MADVTKKKKKEKKEITAGNLSPAERRYYVARVLYWVIYCISAYLLLNHLPHLVLYPC